MPSFARKPRSYFFFPWPLNTTYYLLNNLNTFILSNAALYIARFFSITHGIPLTTHSLAATSSLHWTPHYHPTYTPLRWRPSGVNERKQSHQTYRSLCNFTNTSTSHRQPWHYMHRYSKLQFHRGFLLAALYNWGDVVACMTGKNGINVPVIALKTSWSMQKQRGDQENASDTIIARCLQCACTC